MLSSTISLIIGSKPKNMSLIKSKWRKESRLHPFSNEDVMNLLTQHYSKFKKPDKDINFSLTTHSLF